MIIEEENTQSKEKMKKIYDSIKSNPKLKKHLNTNRTERIKFLQNYPYDNIPYNDAFLFNNICMFNDLSCVNGYLKVDDGIKIIDFNGNFKINEKINLSQRCLLPEKLFSQKYDYQNSIPPLKREVLKEYLIK
jgi:hypothetical protein